MQALAGSTLLVVITRAEAEVLLEELRLLYCSCPAYFDKRKIKGSVKLLALLERFNINEELGHGDI